MNREKLEFLVPYIGLPVLAVAFLLVRWQSMSLFSFLQGELLLIIGYIAAVSDIKKQRVSNQLVLIFLVVWFLSIFPQILLNINLITELLRTAILGFAVSGGLFLAVYTISRGGLGGGDVKFMAVAGLYLGMNGVLQSMLFGSILASLCGLLLILLKKIKRKDSIPLIPFLYGGILITLFFL